MPALQYERPGDPRRDDGARYTLQLLRIRRIFCYDRGSLLTVISRGVERILAVCVAFLLSPKSRLENRLFLTAKSTPNTELQLFNYKSN